MPMSYSQLSRMKMSNGVPFDPYNLMIAQLVTERIGKKPNLDFTDNFKIVRLDEDREVWLVLNGVKVEHLNNFKTESECNSFIEEFIEWNNM